MVAVSPFSSNRVFASPILESSEMPQGRVIGATCHSAQWRRGQALTPPSASLREGCWLQAPAQEEPRRLALTSCNFSCSPLIRYTLRVGKRLTGVWGHRVGTPGLHVMSGEVGISSPLTSPCGGLRNPLQRSRTVGRVCLFVAGGKRHSLSQGRGNRNRPCQGARSPPSRRLHPVPSPTRRVCLSHSDSLPASSASTHLSFRSRPAGASLSVTKHPKTVRTSLLHLYVSTHSRAHPPTHSLSLWSY